MKLLQKFPIFLLAAIALPIDAAVADESKPAKTLQEWLQAHEQWQAQTPIIPSNQLAQAPVGEITGVEVQPTETGIQILFTLPGGADFQVITEQQGTTLTATLQNAQLNLPNQTKFQQADPTATIASVQVKPGPDNTVQVIVIGKSGTPTVQFQQAEGQLVAVIGLTATPIPTPQTEQVRPTPAPDIAQDGIEIVVTAEGSQGFLVPNTSTATGTDTPIRDVPFSVQVIPRQVIEDRAIIRVQETADNVPGVQSAEGYGGLPTGEFYVRGFPSTAYRDGFRDFGFLSPIDVANIERIDFLKGPASALFGLNEPGGIVNIISKPPLFQPYYSPSLVVGSYGLVRPTLDVSGPLDPNGNSAYRLNAAFERADSYVDYVGSQRYFLAPAFTTKINEQTTLNFQSFYLNNNYTFNRGFLPEPEYFQVPISRFLGEPGDNATINSGGFNVAVESQIYDDWKLKFGLSTLLSGIDSDFTQPRRLINGETVTRFGTTRNELSQNYTLQSQAIGNLKTGPISHQLLFGLDIFRQSYQYDLANVQATSINLFNPVYNRERGGLIFDLNELYGVNNVGLYFQDQMTLLDNLKLLVGGRFDISNTFYRDLANDLTYNDSNVSAFTPRVGIVYQPVDPVSLYFSYSTSYNPAIFSVSQSGQPFDPEYGQQFEVGVKGEIIPNQLAATLAFYDISKQNVLVTDPNNPDFSIPTGEQKSQGIEFDITGRPLPGWNLILSYAYTDAFVSQDTTIPIGSRLSGVPYNQFGFFSTYEIQDGPIKGLGFGLGLYYVGDRAVCFDCDITLPSYFRVDLSTFYRRDNWQLTLNIKNLNNVEYYNTQGFLIYPQPPLTVLGTATIRF